MKEYKKHINKLYKEGLLTEKAKKIALTRLEEKLQKEAEESEKELKSLIAGLTPTDINLLKLRLLKST